MARMPSRSPKWAINSALLVVAAMVCGFSMNAVLADRQPELHPVLAKYIAQRADRLASDPAVRVSLDAAPMGACEAELLAFAIAEADVEAANEALQDALDALTECQEGGGCPPMPPLSVR